MWCKCCRTLLPAIMSLDTIPPYWSKTLCGCRTSHPPYEFLMYGCSMFGLWPTLFDATEVLVPYLIAPVIVLCFLWGCVVLYKPSTLERYRIFLYRFLAFFFLQSAFCTGVLYYLMTDAYPPGYIGVNVAGLALHTIGALLSVARLIQVRGETEDVVAPIIHNIV